MRNERLLLLVAGAGLLGACATVDATTTQYVGAPRFPAGDPAKVQILRTEPSRPHDRLGEIMVDASTDPAPPIEKIEDKLRAEAAKLGADAAVVVYDRIQQVGAYRHRPVVGPEPGYHQRTEAGGRGDQIPAVGRWRSGPRRREGVA